MEESKKLCKRIAAEIGSWQSPRNVQNGENKNELPTKVLKRCCEKIYYHKWTEPADDLAKNGIFCAIYIYKHIYNNNNILNNLFLFLAPYSFLMFMFNVHALCDSCFTWLIVIGGTPQLAVSNHTNFYFSWISITSSIVSLTPSQSQQQHRCTMRLEKVFWFYCKTHFQFFLSFCHFGLLFTL